MAGPEKTTIRIDLRAALPLLTLGFIILVIIFVELCGRTEVKPLPQGTPFVEGPTSTPGPTSTVGPSPTPAPAEATATQENAAAGADRDEVRQTDLHTIQTALEQYKQKHAKYPSTGDGIQTVCTFEEFDKGCALKDVLDPIPSDPLGNPGENGYWLKSTETKYTLYSQRESELFSGCGQHPDHLKAFRSVFCVSGP
jgi:hypothetical protein